MRRCTSASSKRSSFDRRGVVVDDLLEELVSSRELLQGLRDRSRVLDTARACRFATPARW
jgi:hypothetical protein